jgi:signal transduction histidine kinase
VPELTETRRAAPASSVRGASSVLSSRPASSTHGPTSALAEVLDVRATEADAVYRSPKVAVAVLAALGTLCLAPLAPSVRAALHLPWRDVVSLLSPVAAAYGFATLLHRRLGARAPAYRAFDLVESTAWLGSASALVVRSGSAQSLFWLLHFAWISTRVWGRDRARDLGLLIFACAGVVLAFALRARPDEGGQSIVAIGASGLVLVVWAAQHALARRLAEVERDRAGTQVLVVERKVQSERGRLARDLHDGVGAELSALVWRARALQDEVADDTTRAELDRFIDRVRLGTDELRSIVWALRAPTEAWDDTVAYLRVRCVELGGDEVEVAVEDRGAPPTMKLSGELRMQLVRIVQEAVRNAVRHARCGLVRVTLAADRDIRATIADDGRGIPEQALAGSQGGLANIRERARRCGGEARIRSSPEGTTIDVRLPLPTRRPDRSTEPKRRAS